MLIGMTTLAALPEYLQFPARTVRLSIVREDEDLAAAVADQLASYDDLVEVVDSGDPTDAGLDLVLVVAGRFGGDERVRELLRAGAPRVVLYSAATDRLSVERAIAAGAAACLSTRLSAAELVRALEDIEAGWAYSDGSSAFARHGGVRRVEPSPSSSSLLSWRS